MTTAIDLIKTFEGLKLKAYKCPAGIWTIGYGHTSGVKPNDVIDEKTALAYLKQDLLKIKLSDVVLNQNQKEALTSLIFNIGQGAFNKSTLKKYLLKKDYKNASLEILKWNKAGGQVLPGLVKRRNAEYRLFIA